VIFGTITKPRYHETDLTDPAEPPDLYVFQYFVSVLGLYFFRSIAHILYSVVRTEGGPLSCYMVNNKTIQSHTPACKMTPKI
jgi:hypothetical protein